LLVAIALGGCAGAARRPPHEAVYFYTGPSPPGDTRHMRVAHLSRVGWALVDGEGKPFYTFSPDRPGVSECTSGPCAADWPLFRLTRLLTLDYSAMLELHDIKIEFDPEGSRMVRYKGQVLHTYVGDTSPGQARGEGRVAGGGHWHVVRPYTRSD
jgi:predicted lipoprotein with Yx(FWY)xxD motif